MNKIIYLVLLTFLSVNVFSQSDTTICFSSTNKIINISARYLRKVIMKNKNNFELDEYFNKGVSDFKILNCYDITKLNDSTFLFNKILAKDNEDNTFIRIYSKADSGYLIKDYHNSKLQSIGNSSLIFPLVEEGKWIHYYTESGAIESEIIYKNGECLKSKSWTESGQEQDADIYVGVEEMPEYEGGVEELSRLIRTNIKYPQEARETGDNGTVYITFVILEDGSIKDIRVLRGVSDAIDKEAMRVVGLMNKHWKPGKKNGKAVKVQFNLPIKFSLG